MSTFNLKVVAPAGQVLDQEVEFAVLPSEEGELGILANHAPPIASLEAGIIRYTEEGKEKKLAVSGGFVEVVNNKVSVLANAAEKAENIDVDRALAAKERAQERLKEKTPDIDVLRAEMALKRAVVRLKAADKL